MCETKMKRVDEFTLCCVGYDARWIYCTPDWDYVIWRNRIVKFTFASWSAQKIVTVHWKNADSIFRMLFIRTTRSRMWILFVQNILWRIFSVARWWYADCANGKHAAHTHNTYFCMKWTSASLDFGSICFFFHDFLPLNFTMNWSVATNYCKNGKTLEFFVKFVFCCGAITKFRIQLERSRMICTSRICDLIWLQIDLWRPIHWIHWILLASRLNYGVSLAILICNGAIWAN